MTWSFQRNNDHFDDLTKRDNLGGSYKIVLDNNDRNVIGNSEPDVKRNSGSTLFYGWVEGSNKYLFGKYSESSLVLEVSELELV